MQFAPIRQAIFNWIKSAASEVPGVTVYWDEPNAPRPPAPSLRLSFATGPTAVGLDSVRSIAANPNKFQIVGNRTMILSINAYTAHGSQSQSQQLLSDVVTSISNPKAMDGLAAVNISVLRTSPPRDLNFTMETKIEARSQMDVTLLATENKLIDLNSIETVEVSGEINGIDLYSDI